MSRNGNGQYTLPAGNPVIAGTTITTDWANNTLNDIATALTGSVASDGQTAMQGNLDMSNNKIVGLTNGTNPQDAATVSQLADATITGGTIDGAPIGLSNPKDGNFLALTANTGAFSAGLTAPTVTPSTDVSNKVATTQFVQNAIAAVSSGVTSFNGRSGVVTLQAADVNNALGYTPYNAGTSTVVNTDNILDYTVGKTGQGANGTWGISISGNAASANSANSVDSITNNQVTTALGYVPLSPNSPAMNGTPTAPTATAGTNTTQVATCAFVLANQGGGGGAVSSVNGKTGAVTLNAADVGAYANSNPSGFTTLSAVQAQGYTTLAIVQSQGYVTNSALTNFVTTNTTQTISGAKTFSGVVTSPAYNFTAGTSIYRDPGTGSIHIFNGSTGQMILSTAGGLQVSTGVGIIGGGSLQPNSIQTGSDAGWGLSKQSATMFLNANPRGWRFQSDGSCINAKNTGSWDIESDIRIKQNITPVNNAMEKLMALNPVFYEYKNDPDTERAGFIAQEYIEVFPDAKCEIETQDSLREYVDNEETVLGISIDLNAYYVKAIQDLNKAVIDLQAQVEILKAK